MSPTFKAMLAGAVLMWLAFLLFMLSLNGCAVKTLSVTSLDESHNPIKIEGSVMYFCTDTNTKGFTAQFGETIKIGLASQDARAKTEMMLEFMKMVSQMPQERFWMWRRSVCVQNVTES